jgi:hypothetical protein
MVQVEVVGSGVAGGTVPMEMDTLVVMMVSTSPLHGVKD